ncbi:ComF family protein [Pseudalkalibacillus hwajinpoensis]|uniref:ComF family protein n=1 Tax=Guptibacillus hwajinpoensis TaxID=208199 RepID=A0A4U1MI35_9BACL|nr:ComF family protein [Pseudalkalibacillus hwajinpoensis]TKD70989.1 ComF family protein [Pseudalkalibacillus hwajinpoensis]
MAQLERCVWCKKDLSRQLSWRIILGLAAQRVICETCQAKLVPITGELCLKCGRPLSKLKPDYIQDHYCSDCIKWRNSEFGNVLESNKSFYEYNDFLKDILSLYKFRGDVEAGRVFSAIFKKEILKSFGDVDGVIPIPSSEERLYDRGFNQCEVWIEGTEFHEGQILYRINHEEKQSKKSREKRINRKKDMFQLHPKVTIEGKTFLLIDDLYTTGTTLHYAAKTLKNAGASHVSSLTLCRS